MPWSSTEVAWRSICLMCLRKGDSARKRGPAPVTSVFP